MESKSDKAGNTLDEKAGQGDGNWRVTAGDTPGSVVLAGEIDFSVAPKVRARLLEVVGKGAQDVSLDLGDLAYIDSSGLALLIELRKHLVDAGGAVRIRSISPQVRKIFNLTQLSELFGLTD